MIKNIVLVVILYLLIALIRHWLKRATEKEAFTDTLYLSKAYQIFCHIAALFLVVAGIIFGLFLGFKETIGLDIFFAFCIVLIEICAVMLRRHKVIVKNDTLCITPVIGRATTIHLNEITQLKERNGIGLQVYSGKKKICTISCDCVGYRQFVEMLKDKNML